MRLALVFAVLTAAVAAGLWVLGLVGADQAADSAGRIIALVAIVGGSLAAIGFLLRPTKAPPPDSGKPGPKF